MVNSSQGGIVVSGKQTHTMLKSPYESPKPEPSLFSDIFYENLIFKMVNRLSKNEKKAIYTIIKDYLESTGKYNDICRY